MCTIGCDRGTGGGWTAWAGADPQALSDGEAVERLHRCLARLEAVTTRATAAFDASRAWEGRGARSAAAWVSVRCGVAPASAHRRVHLGRALRHLPVAEAAWVGGDIDSSRVSMMAKARTPATEDALARDEDVLVGQAKRMRFAHFVRALAYWRYRADRHGCERDARRVRDGDSTCRRASAACSWVIWCSTP